MITTIGKLAEFCPDSGNIDVYLERFELFATANGIDASKKLQVFLTILGEKAYVTLGKLLLPRYDESCVRQSAIAQGTGEVSSRSTQMASPQEHVEVLLPVVPMRSTRLKRKPDRLTHV